MNTLRGCLQNSPGYTGFVNNGKTVFRQFLASMQSRLDGDAPLVADPPHGNSKTDIETHILPMLLKVTLVTTLSIFFGGQLFNL